VLAAGEGARSVLVNEQGVTVDHVLMKPTNLATTIPFRLGITANWVLPRDTGVGETCSTDCRPLTAYRLIVQNGQSVQILDALLDPAIVTYTLQNLDHTQTYTFSVTASNSAGQSSQKAVTIEQPVEYLSAPLQFLALVSNVPYKVDLSWRTPADTGRVGDTEPIISYFLEVDTSVNNTFQAGNLMAVCDGLTVQCTGLTCACAFTSASVTFLQRRFASYNFRVKARSQVGFSGYAYSS